MSFLSFPPIQAKGSEKHSEIVIHENFLRYFEGLPIEDRAIFFMKLKTFKDLGFELKPPHVEKVNNLIWAYRFKMNKKWIRIFYFFNKGKFVFLHILEKKTNRFPKQDVELANRRAKAYMLGSSSRPNEQAPHNYISA